MEVVLGAEHEGLVLGDTLYLVSPLTGDFDGSLNSLGTSVHRQNHVVAKDLADLLGPLGEDIVVESTRREREAAGLLGQGLHEFGVAVALVNGRVGGQEVHVLAALGVPDVDALSAGKDDGERRVVVSSELVLGGNGLVGGGGVEARSASGQVSVGRHVDKSGREPC